MRESRPGVLLHHINMAVKHSALTFRAYATQVRDVYDERTPLALRGLVFRTTRDPYLDEKLNAQTLQRVLDEPNRIPCALEESLVLALPEPFQGECRRELAARMGELAAPMPRDNHGAAMADAGTLMRETGEALAQLAQSFDGNTILPHQRAAALRACGELDDVMSAVVAIKTRLAKALDGDTPVVSLHDKKAG